MDETDREEFKNIADKESALKSESDTSLTLSLTPPIVDDDKIKTKENSEESISEHLTSNPSSIEHDRSFQEIEISGRPSDIFLNISSVNDKNLIADQDEPTFLEDKSNISNFLERGNILNVDTTNNVHSILEEILNNEQFQSTKESNNTSKEESLNIFENLNLDDQSLTYDLTGYNQNEPNRSERNLFATNFDLPLNEEEAEKRLKDFEELLAIKDTTIAVLTSELDSVRDMSNTNTGSTLSTTEYKQLQEECHNKIMEYNSIIIYKNDLIQKLSESLDQSVTERKELLNQIDRFRDEITQLQIQLQDTSKMVDQHKCDKALDNEEDVVNYELISTNEKPMDTSHIFKDHISLDNVYIDFKNILNSEQKILFEDLKLKINEYVGLTIATSKDEVQQQIEFLKKKAQADKEEYDSEISRLRDLLENIKCGSTEIMELKNELEAKHSREMEELRTYFEKKCADVEKNYSEEIFSQQSRKMSGSTCSDADLNSELIFSHPPGPDGDIKYSLQPNITKKDVINLQNELNSLLSKIGKYNLDMVTEEDFSNLKSEIGKSNLNILLKYDLSIIKGDLQNKYHAELEILREDNETKLDVLNIQYEDKLKSLENKYMEEIESLKMEIDELHKHQSNVCSTVQEVRLAANESDDEEWPSELLQLRDRFTEKYENTLEILKKEHQEEIDKLKAEHLKTLNNALDRAKRRSLRDNDSLSKGELEILRERDSLKNQVSSLRNLFSELLKYFTQCEDELNNTLVDELLKQGFEKNLLEPEDDLNITDISLLSQDKNEREGVANVTRVHLTPNFNELINLIDSTCHEEGDIKDISFDLRNELGCCLEKLKQEANAILALTTNISKSDKNNMDQGKPSNLEERVNSLTRQVISETQTRGKIQEELDDMMKYVESLEKEKNHLENQLDELIVKENMLEADLIQAKNKIAELIENGHKEIISEGYGEEGIKSQRIGDTIAVLTELQEKARNMLAQSRTSADPTLLQLIEELCRVGENIKEEAKREKYDLMQQIEVADKKYKTTQQFLEEQAIEREQERDEAQKKIDLLHNQLRERDKDKMNCERVTSEVEQLEHQLQEMTKALQDENLQCKELEFERNEAVEKIKILRDIIRDLEVQNQAKQKEIDDYSETIHRLECIVEQQDRSLNNFKQSDSSRDVSDIGELYKHIEQLENELQQLRVGAELAGGESTAQEIKKWIFEIENQIDKKTKELEILHSTNSTNCSSPSEDISARDLVRSKSPNIMDDCEVPLQQLARLKEKLVRHSRAEDAAIKRIKDLEMQVFSIKNELEESNGEKEYMKKQLQEQLVLISDLQIRLDEQRIRAEHIEKQTNTSLEMKIYDMQNEILSLQEKLSNKDKALTQQHVLLVETQQKMKNIEEEITATKDDEIIVTMQKEIEKLLIENAELQAKLQKDAKMVPNIVENIIQDKNVDIEKLRTRLDDTEKLLEMYTSLNLDKMELQTLSNLKNNGTSLTEIVSILELSQVDQMRRLDNHSRSKSLSSEQLLTPKLSEETLLEPEISAIVGPDVLHSGIHLRNSTEVSQKRVHFEDTDIDKLKSEIAELETKLITKDQLIKDYEEKLELLNNLETKIEKLQLSLDETEKALATAKETFEREQEDLRSKERDLGVKLAEAKLHLDQKDKKIDNLEKDSARKDEMCLKLTKEKKNLERDLEAFKNIEATLQRKNREINTLKEQLSANSSKHNSLIEQLQDKDMSAISLQTEVEDLSFKFNNLKKVNKELEEKLKISNNECSKLNKEIQNNMVQIETMTTEINNFREKLNKKRKLIKEHEDQIDRQSKLIEKLEEQNKKQKEIIADNKCEIDIFNEDAKRYQNDIAQLEYDLKQIKKGINTDDLKQQINNRDDKITELEKEKSRLNDLIGEKERIIGQMAEDSHQLHLNLVTIKSKLKEPGNIIDLGNKLKEEQKKTAELLQEVHNLKAQLLKYKNTVMIESVDEITDQLKKELDYSAQIDSNIMTAVSDQSLSSISETQDVEIYKKALTKEKLSKKQLLSQINMLQMKNNELQNVLEKEKCSLMQLQSQDAKLIEQLRIQLDTVLDHEEAIKKELDDKKNSYQQLEREMEALKRKNISSASKTDSTEYKHFPSKEAIELNQLRKDFEFIQSERNQLLNEVMVLNQAKIEAESSFKHINDILNLEVQRTKSLEEKVQHLNEIERGLKDELIQRRIEIEGLTNQLEQERANFSKQRDALITQLRTIRSTENVNLNSAPISEELLDKIRQLNSALLDNRKLMDCIQKISYEKQMLEREITQLRTADTHNGNVSDLIARCDFLFAKTLKLESIKKALIWQKRYLTEYLQSHEKHCLLQTRPTTERFKNEFQTKTPPRQKFKSVVYVVISILRMKYLVKRWHSGVRIAEKVNSRHYRNLSSKPDYKVTNFHVGQPVSSQLFSNAPFTKKGNNPFEVHQRNPREEDRMSVHSAADNIPWSGNTPPSKEKNDGRIRIGSTVLQREDLNPLRAPELLAQFIERFDQIQEKMGVVLDSTT